MFAICKATESKKGTTYYKGLVSILGRQITITVWPSSDKSTCKVTFNFWRRNSNNMGMRRTSYRRANTMPYNRAKAPYSSNYIGDFTMSPNSTFRMR